MAWDQLSINKPHLVYIILGGFTSIFMLMSLFIKEKLYIGEATVATICGVIFGPHAADLINPATWGNVDQITLEFSRIVLVVQCFAVGVELPKAYMERHWRSVVFLLVPVMTFGWLITSVFVWWMVPPLSWLESLVVAACVTATDPVLASSVVGKGKFAKRVPKHLRDVLSAESGCNDGMAFPFIYLSLYLLRYDLDAKHVVFHWTCYTILYECIFGAVYGVAVGYIGRRAIRLCERKGIIDRESFLVFYFTLALFCAGSGSLLGMDDLLVGFAAGVGFSNDGWFTEKTEESHVSNVIDLLINLAYFVYFGTIIPWDQFNAPDHGLIPWRLVVLALLVVFFRRIPAMLMLKPFIPDIKNWREALFAGHFGPIGVGAIFVAILARAELESETTVPLAVLPEPGSKDYDLIYLVWPVTCFLVMTSIVVHGSSIAVFTLGKRINTLTLTLSYTQDNEKGAAWMNRLPRITSQSRSMSRADSTDIEDNEKMDVPPGQLPPIGIPKLHLRRQKEEDYPNDPNSNPNPKPRRRRKRKDYGGPISASAITPARRSEPNLTQQESGSDTLFDKSQETSPDSHKEEPPTRQSSSSSDPKGRRHSHDPDERAEVECYEEGDDLIIEDKEGNVLKSVPTAGKTGEEKAAIVEKVRKELGRDTSGKFSKHKDEPHSRPAADELGGDNVEDAGPQKGWKSTFDKWKGFGRSGEEDAEQARRKEQPPQRKRGAAHAYQFGNQIIVEDEDGEVIRTYTIPGAEKGEGRNYGQDQMKEGLRKMSTWVGMKGKPSAVPEGSSTAATTGEGKTDNKPLDEDGKSPKKAEPRTVEDLLNDDDGLRMIVSRSEQYGWTGLKKKTAAPEGGPANLGGRRMSTRDFLLSMQQMDPKRQLAEVDDSNAPEEVKKVVRTDAKAEIARNQAERPKASRNETAAGITSPGSQRPVVARRSQSEQPTTKSDLIQRPQPERTTTSDTLKSIEEAEIPEHDVRGAVVRHGKGQTAAEARRERLTNIPSNDEIYEEDDESDDGEGRAPTAAATRRRLAAERDAEDAEDVEDDNDGEEGETAAEKRRRLAALGLGGGDESDSSESEEEAGPRRPREAVQEPGILEVGPAANRRLRVQWGGESGRNREAESPDDTEQHTGVGRKVKGMFKNKS